jgi:2-haloacid dehalogenase
LPRWASFDCYGTLIDWNGGIRSTLARLWPESDADELLARYHELEREVEREHPSLPYREVMRGCLHGIGEREALLLAPEQEGALGDSLPSWQPFPEVPGTLAELRRRGFSLAVLSNTDPDFLNASLRLIGVPVDERVIASEIGSYKPAHRHWRVFFERTGAAGDEHAHVGASVFHDIAPCEELGLRSVWINRLDEEPVPVPVPTRELPSLEQLPDVLEELLT